MVLKWDRRVLVLTASIFLLTVSLAFPQKASDLGELFSGFLWRSVGPAVMGGRTVDVEAVESQPWIIYAAVGPSGVWKSMNNGQTWDPVFHKESTVSVGDLAIDQSNPDIVWVGTGEATCRNSVTIGDGVYKTTDGGKTWAPLGLGETRHISRIVIDRKAPDTVFVAAMGHLWGPNEERGVYKTEDGGKTWTRVLFINKDTGIADLAIDPSDGNVLYAAAYEHRRLPYLYTSGGPGSGLYKTSDGGQTWKKLQDGLPEGLLGRIGIDVSRSNPDVVYALVEHKERGLFRSEDKGETWQRMCDARTCSQVNTRPFYYSQVRVDPSDDSVIYVISTAGYVSENKGKNFRMISAGTHPDHHALWINPSNPLHLIDGNDGGIDISFDKGKTWGPVQNIPAAEVYQVGYDFREPYYVYCGLQDNGVWGGPSASFDSRGIANEDWFMVGGGDGFFVQPDPSDPTVIYANSQVNNLYRYDLRMGRSKPLRPQASFREPYYRFNWNSPIHISPHNPKVVYTGGNVLFRTDDGGHSWKVISPDLSTNDTKKIIDSGGPISGENTGAEVHCTITTISESAAAAGVIWCGTDDGNLQVTRDGGKTWSTVAKNIKGLPPRTWCSRVEASRFAAGTAYASFDGHRTDDYGTYVYKTSDFGRTWASLKSNLPFGWVHVIREDVRNPNLLFVGTEFSVFASLDGGRSWMSLRNNLPTAAVHDIAVHSRENDLIIGTHGLGIWILDDIMPLQEMKDAVLAESSHLFSVRPTTQFLLSSSRDPYTRPYFTAGNPTYGAGITAYFREKPAEQPTVMIKDKEGEEVFQAKLPTKEGIQRIFWNLQAVPKNREGKRVVPPGMVVGSIPFVSPGIYTIELSLPEGRMSREVTVKPDPRFDWPESEREAQRFFIADVFALGRRHGLALTAANAIRREFDRVRKEADEKADENKEVTGALKNFEKIFLPVEKSAQPGQALAWDTGLESLLRGGSIPMRLAMFSSSVSGFPVRPTETEILQLAEMTEIVNQTVETLNDLIRNHLPRLNEDLEKHGISTLNVPAEVKDDPSSS